MALCASVIIDDIVNKIDKLYDYAVPGSIEKNLKAGMRVVGPFSKTSKKKRSSLSYMILSIFHALNILIKLLIKK